MAWRLVLRPAAFGSFGLFMSVLVAFLCAAFAGGTELTFAAHSGADLPWAAEYLGDESNAWLVAKVRGRGLSLECCGEIAAIRRGRLVDDPPRQPLKLAAEYVAPLTAFAGALKGQTPRETIDQVCAIFDLDTARMSAGWPCPAFHGSHGWGRNPRRGFPWDGARWGEVHGDGWLILKVPVKGRTMRFELPARPNPAGLAVDGLFYAGALWLLTRLRSILARALRERRGVCPNCAYPAGVSPVCTECGTALRVRAVPVGSATADANGPWRSCAK